MKILDAGNRIVSTYLYPIENGYVAVDTGYENSYRTFIRNLSRCGIRANDIRYIFLTHAHDDHAGFLNELLSELPSVRVIMSDKGLPALLRGQNSFQGGCSSRLALFFCNVMKILGKGEHKFPPIEKKFLDRVIMITDENSLEMGIILKGNIISTPGHTADSISLLLENGIMFCGDAAMNGFPSVHNITIWIENREAFENSWRNMISLAPKKIYPSHGKPFEVSALKMNIPNVVNMKLYSLKCAK